MIFKRRIAVLVCLVWLVVPAVVRDAAPIDEEASSTPVAPGLVPKDSRTITGPRNFLRGYPAIVAPDTADAVVEMPAGSVDRWELKSDDCDPLDLRSITELND